MPAGLHTFSCSACSDICPQHGAALSTTLFCCFGFCNAFNQLEEYIRNRLGCKTGPFLFNPPVSCHFLSCSGFLCCCFSVSPRLTHVKTNIFHTDLLLSRARWKQQSNYYFTLINRNWKFLSSVQEQLEAATAYKLNSGRRKLNSELHKLPQARSLLLFSEARKLPMNSPQRHICFSKHGNTVVVGGWENGAVLENFVAIDLQKTDDALSRITILGVFLGKPQISGKPGRMRVWVHCSLPWRSLAT